MRPPSGVYLMAFDTRLAITWRSICSSPSAGPVPLVSNRTRCRFSSITVCISRSTLRVTSSSRTACRAMIVRPLSSRAMSSRSLTSVLRRDADSPRLGDVVAGLGRQVLRFGGELSIQFIPRSGVRSWWLTKETKSDFHPLGFLAMGDVEVVEPIMRTAWPSARTAMPRMEPQA